MIDVRKILIVGVTGTLGVAIANKLKSEGGYEIFGTSKSGIQEIDTLQALYKLDLSDNSSIEEQVYAILKEQDELHGIVFASGLLKTGFSLLTKSEPELLQVNFLGVLTSCKILMRKYMNKGLKSVVFIASSSATNSDGGRLGYSASKAALVSAGQTLAREMGGKGVRVNCVSPGLIESKMVNDTIDPMSQLDLLNRIFLKRLGKPSEVASVVTYLLSDESAYITGQNIAVDGGMSW